MQRKGSVDWVFETAKLSARASQGMNASKRKDGGGHYSRNAGKIRWGMWDDAAACTTFESSIFL